MIFEQIDFIPIDLPHLDVDINAIQFNSSYNWWKFTKLIKSKNKYAIGEWIELDNPVYEKIKKYIITHIPIDHFVNVKINYQLSAVDNHIDFVNPELNPELYKYNKETEPCGYRLLLSGSRHALGINNEQAFLPSDTNVYCIRQTETLHNVDDDKNRVSIFIQGWVNKDRHYTLLEKSYKKYKEQIIWKK
jgi:hypothetical protein